MATETDVNEYLKSLETELEAYLKKTSDSVSFDVIQYDPVAEQLVGLIDAIVDYLNIYRKHEVVLSGMQRALKEDIETEMLDLKEQLEKLLLYIEGNSTFISSVFE